MATLYRDESSYFGNKGEDILSLIGGLLKSELESLDGSHGFMFLALNYHKSFDSGAIYFEHVYNANIGDHFGSGYYGDVRKSRCSISQPALYGCDMSPHRLGMVKNIVLYMMGLFKQDVEMTFHKQMNKNVKPESPIMPETYGVSGYKKVMGIYAEEPSTKLYAGFKEAFSEAAASKKPEKKPSAKKRPKQTMVIAIISDESTKNIAKNLEL